MLDLVTILCTKLADFRPPPGHESHLTATNLDTLHEKRNIDVFLLTSPLWMTTKVDRIPQSGQNIFTFSQEKSSPLHLAGRIFCSSSCSSSRDIEFTLHGSGYECVPPLDYQANLRLQVQD